MKSLDQWAHEVHALATKKGFWDLTQDQQYEVMGMKLALIHSEVTEVLEAIRKNKGEEAIMDEFADVIIRTLDLYAWMNETIFEKERSLDFAIQQKHDVNSGRAKLHGNKF